MNLTRLRTLVKSRKKLILILGVVLLSLGLLATLTLVKTEQDIRQRAAEPTGDQVFHSYTEQVQEGQLPPPTNVLLIALSYNANATPVLSIDQAREITGYVPGYPPVDNAYTLKVLNAQSQTLYQIPFAIPNVVYDAPPLPGEAASQAETHRQVQTRAHFSLTIPVIANSSTLEILDPKGVSILHYPIASIPKAPKSSAAPNFKTRYGDEIIQNKRRVR